MLIVEMYFIQPQTRKFERHLKENFLRRKEKSHDNDDDDVDDDSL